MPLSRERDTPSKGRDLRTAPVAAGARIWQGALVVLDAGFARPGLAALNLVALGRARASVDNATGAAGDQVVECDTGVFLFRNAVADPIGAADLGRTCFVVDDEIVARTNGTNTRSVAGIVRGIEPAGVWVEI